MLLVHVPQFNLCRVELSYIGKMRNGGMIWIQIVQCVYLMFQARVCELCQKEKLTKEWSKLNENLWDLKKKFLFAEIK